MPSASQHQAEGAAPRTKRGSIACVACNTCRRRKTRCDGKRPACRRCKDSGKTCVYEANVNESRQAALKRENEELRRQLARFNDQADRQHIDPHAPQDIAAHPPDDESLSTLAPSLSSHSQSAALSPMSSWTASYPHAFSITDESLSWTNRDHQSMGMGMDSRRSSRASLPTSTSTCQALIHALTSQSDNEATMTLAKLRLGIPWSQIVDQLADSGHPISPSRETTHSNYYRDQRQTPQNLDHNSNDYNNNYRDQRQTLQNLIEYSKDSNIKPTSAREPPKDEETWTAEHICKIRLAEIMEIPVYRKLSILLKSKDGRIAMRISTLNLYHASQARLHDALVEQPGL
ncbi:hypothetical protein M409DRAFT_61233 [Zasmidium cellare ATCC 36951]|uniref:Zn(2)-C6 fungal-type domain-containing protein n=1 Tax=Zasmidium cellare ATCC 36951 TaxID=1080233 RepID=A0A6A6BVY5_ZASCE|nr:uncharacterized protein M409DRAFT_61233 [Zasmidium cellare ATCC 36951]KAF2158967.1 hypothetical protein M409DRAFT_61233 [Zasmidium cellare ATCC 36951]